MEDNFFRGALCIEVSSTFNIDLLEKWGEIQSTLDHYVFQTHEWLAHWQKEVGQYQNVQPIIVVASDEGGVLAIFPFAIRKVGFIRVLEFLGGGQTDYSAPLLMPDVLMPAKFMVIWNRVLKSIPKFDAYNFLHIPDSLGDCVNPLISLTSSFFEGYAYQARLPDSWDEYRKILPPKLRADNSRSIRRLSEMGRLEFKVAKSDAENKIFINAMFEQKERRFLETGAINILSNKYVRSFYFNAGAAMRKDPRIHLSALVLDGEILATHLGVIYKGRFYYLFPTYVGGSFAKFSTGRILLEFILEWAITNGIKTFDFTIGAEAYKEIWSNSQIKLYRIVEPVTLAGYVFTWIQKRIFWIKNTPALRRFILKILRIKNFLKSNLFTRAYVKK